MEMVHKLNIDMKDISMEYSSKSGPPKDIKMEDITGGSDEYFAPLFSDSPTMVPSKTPSMVPSMMPSSPVSFLPTKPPNLSPAKMLSLLAAKSLSSSPAIKPQSLSPAKVPSTTDDPNVIEMISAPGVVKYKCKFCLYNHHAKEVVSLHVSAQHSNMKQFKCTQCSYSTTKKIEFIAHKAEHGNVSSDQNKVAVEPTEYRCGECDYTTYSKLDYDEHKRGHDNEVMPYQCNICSFASDSELAMVRHMSSAHIENTDGVEIIIPRAPEDDVEDSMDMDYQTSFNYNTATDDSYTYPHDSILGMDASNMSSEFDSARSSREGTPSESSQRNILFKLMKKIQTAEGTFFCPECGLKYKRSSDLNRHMKQKHDIR